MSKALAFCGLIIVPHGHQEGFTGLGGLREAEAGRARLDYCAPRSPHEAGRASNFENFDRKGSEHARFARFEHREGVRWRLGSWSGLVGITRSELAARRTGSAQGLTGSDRRQGERERERV